MVISVSRHNTLLHICSIVYTPVSHRLGAAISIHTLQPSLCAQVYGQVLVVLLTVEVNKAIFFVHTHCSRFVQPSHLFIAFAVYVVLCHTSFHVSQQCLTYTVFFDTYFACQVHTYFKYWPFTAKFILFSCMDLVITYFILTIFETIITLVVVLNSTS